MNCRNVRRFMEKPSWPIPTHTPLLPCRGQRRYGCTDPAGAGPARIPTGGKSAPASKCSRRKAARQPQAKAIYDQGVAAGQSFEQIERAIAEALPDLKTPLVPRNVPWFSCGRRISPIPRSPGRFWTPMARIRGEGRRLYRFPVVFPLRLLADRDAPRTGGLGRAREALLVAILGRWPGAPLHVPCAQCRSTRRAGAPSASSAGARP